LGLNDKRNKRLELIKAIEEKLGSKLVVYITADSPIVGGMISEDAIIPMFDHLRAIGKQKLLTLYLYSPGGQMETPWKLVTMLREFCEELHVVVPYKAYSAATMICMGTDKIHMTSKAELGPIDPALQVNPLAGKDGSALRLPDLGVEDIAGYLTFIRERAKLTDQAAVSAAVTSLAEHLTPPLLGRIERVYSHIRLVARNLLALHKPPMEDRKISAISEALIEKIYVHGHGIGRKEAKEIGLDVVSTDGPTEGLVWSLYEEYETEFRLRETRDVEFYFPANSDLYERPDTAVACIESEKHLHECTCRAKAQRIRNTPPNPVINVNLAFNFPGNVNPQQLPQQLQQLIQQFIQQAVQQLQGLVAQELQRQSPVAGLSVQGVGAVWRKLV
jgi:Serine dehydrogenase proteinase